MEYKSRISYIGDCPNEGDFQKIVKNLTRILQVQEEAWKRISKEIKPEVYE